MKKFFILFFIVSFTTNIFAQIKIVDNNMAVIGKIVPGVTYPNISKDKDGNFYLVNNTECESNTDNLQVIKLGKKEDALKTLDFFKDFIKSKERGASIDIQDESTGYKYRIFNVARFGQGGLKFESLDNHYSCAAYFFIKNVNKAIKIVESGD